MTVGLIAMGALVAIAAMGCFLDESTDRLEQTAPVDEGPNHT